MSLQRIDGRLPNELRDIIVVFDGLEGVDGSARFGFGDTKALASVSGPIEVRLAAEQANKATFEVLVRPLAGIPGTDAKALASFLRSALTPSIALTHHPRTLIQLVVQSLTSLPPSALRAGRSASATASIMRAHPALVAALINASTLALVDAASFPMKGMVCAVAVGRLSASARAHLQGQRRDPVHVEGQGQEEQDHGLDLIVDPSESELAHLDGAGSFAFLVSGSYARPSSTSTSTTSTFSDVHSKIEAEETDASSDDKERSTPTAQLVWSSWSATPVRDANAVSSGGEDLLVRATELARAGALRVWEHMRAALVLQYQRQAHRGPSVKSEVDDEDEDKKAAKKEEEVDDAKMEIS